MSRESIRACSRAVARETESPECRLPYVAIRYSACTLRYPVPMKPDRYTKAVLTVIALMLVVIACTPLINPNTTAEAQGSFAGV